MYHATYGQAAVQQFAVGFFDLFHVFQQVRFAAVHLDRIDQRAEQRLHGMRFEQHLLHQAPHRLAGHATALLGSRCFRHGDGGGIQIGQGDFGKQAAWVLARKTAEIRARRAVQTHRQNGRAGLGGNKAGAVVNLHQATGQCDAAFGENHYRLACVQQLDDFLHRQRAGGINRQMRYLRQDQAEPEVLQHRGMHHEGSPEGEEEPEQKAVEKRLMIGDNQQLLLLRNRFLPDGFDAE